MYVEVRMMLCIDASRISKSTQAIAFPQSSLRPQYSVSIARLQLCNQKRAEPELTKTKTLARVLRALFYTFEFLDARVFDHEAGATFYNESHAVDALHSTTP